MVESAKSEECISQQNNASDKREHDRHSFNRSTVILPHCVKNYRRVSVYFSGLATQGEAAVCGAGHIDSVAEHKSSDESGVS